MYSDFLVSIAEWEANIGEISRDNCKVHRGIVSSSWAREVVFTTQQSPFWYLLPTLLSCTCTHAQMTMGTCMRVWNSLCGSLAQQEGDTTVNIAGSTTQPASCSSYLLSEPFLAAVAMGKQLVLKALAHCHCCLELLRWQVRGAVYTLHYSTYRIHCFVPF